MPIYEYECGACGQRLEAFQKMRDAPLVDCGGCGQPRLKKLVSAAGFRLSGSGWYETDFKGGDKRKNVHEKWSKEESSPGADQGAKVDNKGAGQQANSKGASQDSSKDGKSSQKSESGEKSSGSGRGAASASGG